MTPQNMEDKDIQMLDRLVGLDSCPHCGVAKPEMAELWKSRCIIPRGGTGYGYNWSSYRCTSCKQVVLAQSILGNDSTRDLLNVYPSIESVDKELPERARHYLQQAIGSLHAPDGAAMLAGSAVDAMLKKKGLKSGSVYARIDKAVEKHVLTKDMADWAHDVRLGSNRPRHADDDEPHVTPEEARQAVEFVKTLGLVLFVLPNRVASRGLDKSPEPESG